MDAFGAVDLRSSFDTHLYDAESGHYISSNHQNLAEVIKDYDPNMEMVWIPPADRANTDTHPFAVVKREPATGYTYIVMKLTDADMNRPDEVLRRLWMGDTTKNDVISSMEALEAARQALKLKAQMEKREELKDFGKTILKSNLHTFKHAGRVYS